MGYFIEGNLLSILWEYTKIYKWELWGRGFLSLNSEWDWVEIYYIDLALYAVDCDEYLVDNFFGGFVIDLKLGGEPWSLVKNGQY